MWYETANVSERQTLPPAVAVSTVAFALHPPAEARLGEGARASAASATVWIPLVRRTRPPFRGFWALPGGPTQWDETLSDTALRTLHAAVLREPGYLEQLYSFGSVERSASAQRLVTIAYWALYGEQELADVPASKDENVAWFSVDELPDLAFDHGEIIAYARGRLRVKTEYSEIAQRFLGSPFTLGRLRAVHEAILGERVDPANFRRQILSRSTLVDTGELEKGARHRPARLYRFNEDPKVIRSRP